MVAHRYHDPFTLIDRFISVGGLSRFILGAWRHDQEDRLWQFYLAKVQEQSFDSFKREHGIYPEGESVERSDIDLKAIISGSRDVVESFNRRKGR